MTRLPNVWIPAERWSACGENVSSPIACPGWRNCRDRAAPGLFPPELVVKIKALACELPAQHQQPLARWRVPALTRYIRETGLVAKISDRTLWRWLHEEAIRPWQHRCWIFPRDPDFESKAGRLLDLYERTWAGRPLGQKDFVISADETKPARGFTRLCRRRRISRCGLSTNTSGAAPGLISPPGTCIAPRCSAGANTKAGSPPLTGWSSKS
jgi:hypothetical protein